MMMKKGNDNPLRKAKEVRNNWWRSKRRFAELGVGLGGRYCKKTQKREEK